jgi:hypothetical protein
MPEHWMDWAKLIGSFIGATFLASFAGWKVWTKILRPVVVRFEPIVNEITGPGNEPGLRQMVTMVGSQAGFAASSARDAAEGVNLLRRDVQGLTAASSDLRKDVDDLKISRDKHGERIGALEGRAGAQEARLARVETVQDSLGCAGRVVHVHETTTEEAPTTRGRSPVGDPPPPPRD